MRSVLFVKKNSLEIELNLDNWLDTTGTTATAEYSLPAYGSAGASLRGKESIATCSSSRVLQLLYSSNIDETNILYNVHYAQDSTMAPPVTIATSPNTIQKDKNSPYIPSSGFTHHLALFHSLLLVFDHHSLSSDTSPSRPMTVCPSRPMTVCPSRPMTGRLFSCMAAP
jgi:hypothetical protein